MAKDIGPAALCQHLDVSDPDGWQRVVTNTLEAFGTIDILINNAGISLVKLIADTTLEEWNRLIAVNQTGVFLGMQAVFPTMSAARRGAVVNTSAITGRDAMDYNGAYGATKAAIGVSDTSRPRNGPHSESGSTPSSPVPSTLPSCTSRAVNSSTSPTFPWVVWASRPRSPSSPASSHLTKAPTSPVPTS